MRKIFTILDNICLLVSYIVITEEIICKFLKKLLWIICHMGGLFHSHQVRVLYQRDLQLGHDSRNEITLLKAPGKGNYLLRYLVLKCF